MPVVGCQVKADDPAVTRGILDGADTACTATCSKNDQVNGWMICNVIVNQIVGNEIIVLVLYNIKYLHVRVAFVQNLKKTFQTLAVAKERFGTKNKQDPGTGRSDQAGYLFLITVLCYGNHL